MARYAGVHRRYGAVVVRGHEERHDSHELEKPFGNENDSFATRIWDRFLIDLLELERSEQL